MPEAQVYLNGRTIPASEAHLAIFDAGLVLGATVTEQTRTFQQRLYRLEDHLDRLFRSLHYTRIDIGLSKAELASISEELITHNARLLDEGDELGLIHFVTPGEYAAYAGLTGRPARTTPTVCVHTFPLPFERWAGKMQTGAHLVTPSVRQVPPQCYDPKMKCRSRMHYYLAEKEAQMVDPEASALLLDLDGNVTETNAANFLMAERGVLASPTPANTLPGISRATVIELAGQLGIPFVERDIQVFSALNADEALLTSTPFCLMPVTRINGVPIGDGKPGPIYRRLIEAWSRRVGVDIEQQMVEGAKRRLQAREQAAKAVADGTMGMPVKGEQP
jgi:branched-subunit amino acid aminotransferase/4-amino-4-deoxychorismate lyase